MKKLIPLLTLGILAIPMMVFAQTGNAPTLPGPGQTNITSDSSILEFVCRAFNYVFLALLLAAVAFVLLAAYRYLTAAGAPDKLTLANHTLILAAVAIAVALLARSVPVIVGSFILQDQSNSSYDVCGG